MSAYGEAAAASVETAKAILTRPVRTSEGRDEGEIMEASAHALAGIGFALIETNRWLEEIYAAISVGGA